MNDTDIAVVGVGCRFPDAWTPTQFWRNIGQGVGATPGRKNGGYSRERATAAAVSGGTEAGSIPDAMV